MRMLHIIHIYMRRSIPLVFSKQMVVSRRMGGEKNTLRNSSGLRRQLPDLSYIYKYEVLGTIDRLQ